MSGTHLDRPERFEELRTIIQRKPALTALYREFYERYTELLTRCPAEGLALEIGSGGGFAADVIPGLVTSDVIPYPGVDRVIDARDMPFEAGSLRAIFLLNVFHHISDPVAFLREVRRCLAPGGRMLIVDQHRGLISGPILQYAHYEPFRPDAPRWEFESQGPLSGANGALAWIVFQRDRHLFEAAFPELALVRYAPHTPLRYWLAGGLKPWSLLPGWTFPLATRVDRSLVRLSPRFGSFVDVEVVRRRFPAP